MATKSAVTPPRTTAGLVCKPGNPGPDETGDEEGAAKAGAEERELRSRTRDEASDVPGAGAQGEADAEFAHAQRHRSGTTP